MRFFSILLLTALSALGLTQSTDQLPKCGQACVSNNFGGCQLLDVACICGNTNLISDLSCCVAKSCSPADQQSIIDFAVNLCKTKGINVPTSASCAATASATNAPSGSAAGNATVASTASLSASSASSATAAQASKSNEAALHHAGSGIGMGVVVAGLIAAL